MPKRVRAFAIRGLMGAPFPRGLGYSMGMDTLTAKLNAIAGVSCTVEDHGSSLWWFSNVGELTEACRLADRSGRAIVLIGHSFGGNAALRIAARLNEGAKPVRVALVAPIDPAAQNTLAVPPNCERVLAYYQKVDPVGRGVVVPAAGWTESEWKKRVTIARRDMAHVAEDDDVRMHREIAAAIANIAKLAA
jgi:pimeloyl-ACP methyl ester carboxylesterase